MRPIDADELCPRLMARYEAHNLDDTRDMAARAAIMSCMEAVERSKTITISQPPNNPLTLEQLQEMDGEPVYVSWPGYNHIGWALVHVWSKRENEVYLTYSNGASDRANYVLDNAKIYRRKPEEDT